MFLIKSYSNKKIKIELNFLKFIDYSILFHKIEIQFYFFNKFKNLKNEFKTEKIKI